MRNTSDETNVGSNHPPPSWRRLEDRQNSERTYSHFGSIAPSLRNPRSPPRSSRRQDNFRRRGSMDPHYNRRHILTRRQEQRIRHYESLPERQIENQLQAPEDAFDTFPVGAVDGRTVNDDSVPPRQMETSHNRRLPLGGTIQHASVDNLTPNWAIKKSNNPLSTENMRMPSEIPANSSEAGRSGSQPMAWRQNSLPAVAIQDSAFKQPILASSTPPDISFNRGQQYTYEPVQPPQNIDIPILTGSISQMQQWYDTIPVGSLFELTGYLMSIVMANPQNRMGPGNEINYILRERLDSGPTMHIIQPYHINFQMQRPLERGVRIRFIGRILSKNRLLAFKMSLLEDHELEFNRVEHVCRSSY